MKLSLAPIPYFWPEQAVESFYASVVDWPVDIVYLGETVCAKRRNLRPRAWLAIAQRLAEAGKEVVLASLALVEAESELSTLRRIAANGQFKIEANDISAVALSAGKPFVAGTTLNAYNANTLAELAAMGAMRWIPPVEMTRVGIEDILAHLETDMETEFLAFGRMPLAFSARCFTARALERAKDDCQLACLDYPEGILLRTREEEAFLNINGIQIQSAKPVNLLPVVHEMRSVGIDILRLAPERNGMEEVVKAFAGVLQDTLSVTDAQAMMAHYFPDTCNGYWFGQAGMQDEGG